MVLFACEKETCLFSTFETSFSRDAPTLCTKFFPLSLLRISAVQLIKRNKLRLKRAWRMFRENRVTKSNALSELSSRYPYPLDSSSLSLSLYMCVCMCVYYICMQWVYRIHPYAVREEWVIRTNIVFAFALIINRSWNSGTFFVANSSRRRQIMGLAINRSV